MSAKACWPSCTPTPEMRGPTTAGGAGGAPGRQNRQDGATTARARARHLAQAWGVVSGRDHAGAPTRRLSRPWPPRRGDGAGHRHHHRRWRLDSPDHTRRPPHRGADAGPPMRAGALALWLAGLWLGRAQSGLPQLGLHRRQRATLLLIDAAIDMRKPVQARCLLVWSCLTGLLGVANGCGSTKEGAGSGGRGGSAGTAGGISTTGGAGGAGGVGTGGTAGTGSPAGTAGSAGTGAAGTAGTGAAGSAGTGVAGSAGGRGGSGGTHTDGGAVPFYPLDMNDVTILAPLPQSIATPVLLRGTDLADDGTAFVPRALYDRLVTRPGAGRPSSRRSRLQAHRQTTTAFTSSRCASIFAIVICRAPARQPRTRGCASCSSSSRMAPAPRTSASMRSTRFGTTRLPAAVAALRELARIAPPQTGALRVSPALSAANPAAYATKLRAFVKRYGGEARLVRLTMNALNLNLRADHAGSFAASRRTGTRSSPSRSWARPRPRSR